MPRDHIPEWAGARSYTDPMQALRGENAKLREQLAEARRVLREVEWSFDNGYDSEDACPICQQPRSTSHVPDCALAAVLAQEGKP